MSDIILCNRPIRAEDVQRHCGVEIDALQGASYYKQKSLSAYAPYMLKGHESSSNQRILSHLSHAPVAKELTNLSLSFGGDNTFALAEITKKLQDYNTGMMGASTSMYAKRIEGFVGAVKDYQKALMEYRSAIESKSAAKAVAKQKALRAFKNMQVKFRHELRWKTGSENNCF